MATQLSRLKLRLDGAPAAANEPLLNDVLETAQAAILARRYPFGAPEGEAFPAEFADLQVRIALDLINRMGAEGELSHGENGLQRTYESSWISESLLREVTPKVGVPL